MYGYRVGYMGEYSEGTEMRGGISWVVRKRWVKGVWVFGWVRNE